ncbi:MAG: hypothetical protein V4660_08555 [Pseudomonadota bacterium]
METYNTQYTTAEYSKAASETSSPTLGAVSWGAILAGATAAAAASLILFVLGTGLGLSSVSPWARSGISGTTFGLTTILWITLTSLVASAIGGYIAGRLRVRWLATHVDEVYFRDTAHGFLAWGLATLATATLLTSVISSIISGAAQVGATVAGNIAGGATAATAAAATTATQNDAADGSANNQLMSYFMDTLFRRGVTTDATSLTDTAPPAGDTPEAKAELARIFANGIATGSLPQEDIRYAGRTISQQTNLSQAEAEKRVTDTFNAVQQKMREAETAARTAADQARKVSAYGSLWLFISLLIGAFVASLAAVYGGRQRDQS